MAMELTKTLRKALGELEGEQEKISRQIAAIRTVLGTWDMGRAPGRGQAPRQGSRPRKAMSAAARKALSRRMKAYWAKRREDAAKAREKAGK